MSPDRQPRWVSEEPVRTADAEFQETLRNDPFVGHIAQEALANFIKATDEVRTGLRRKPVPAEEVTEQVMVRVTEARDAAVAAPDEAYALIFNAQLTGLESLSRTIKATPEVATQPSNTAKKDMSRGKSDRT